MKIDIVEPDPVPVDVVLTLSVEEAGILMAIVGKVVGSNVTIRTLTDEIYYGLYNLNAQGLHDHHDKTIRQIKTGMEVYANESK